MVQHQSMQRVSHIIDLFPPRSPSNPVPAFSGHGVLTLDEVTGPNYGHEMSDFDAIVIGAGHNGLTAAVVIARGGMRVLCLEKNHFIGGMASTTELSRGYQFELAGSIQFPIPNEIYEDLDFASCPIYEPEVMSASIGDAGEAPILLYSDPEKLLNHLGEAIGFEAVMGMAEVAGWAEAPARAIGRFDVRKPPKSLDEMWASATNESEREAIQMAMFGSVMDVVDRYLPDPVQHAPIRSMLAFLAVNSTYRGPYTPGSALCLAFALASPGDATMSKVRGGMGTISDHLLGLFEQHGGELRRHEKVAKNCGQRRPSRRGGPHQRRGHHGARGRFKPRPDRHLHPAPRSQRTV